MRTGARNSTTGNRPESQGEFEPMRHKILILAAVALGAAAVTACDNYDQRDDDYETAPPPMEPVAPSAEDSAAPVVAPDVTDQVPAPAPDTLPPEDRTSEQSVQPESETLFY